MDFNGVRPFICGHSNHTSLSYYYDDEYGVRGPKVWYKGTDGEPHEGVLTVCLDCGVVFVKPIDNTIK
jgi:hypothetical protein